MKNENQQELQLPPPHLDLSLLEQLSSGLPPNVLPEALPPDEVFDAQAPIHMQSLRQIQALWEGKILPEATKP
jgi:hypothetical protein